MKWFVIVGGACSTFSSAMEAEAFIAKIIDNNSAKKGDFVVIYGERYIPDVRSCVSVKEWKP